MGPAIWRRRPEEPSWEIGWHLNSVLGNRVAPQLGEIGWHLNSVLGNRVAPQLAAECVDLIYASSFGFGTDRWSSVAP